MGLVLTWESTMTRKDALSLIGKLIEMTDSYGDHARILITKVDRRHIYGMTSADHEAKIDRTDIVYWKAI
jgi:hypothetical protein